MQTYRNFVGFCFTYAFDGKKHFLWSKCYSLYCIKAGFFQLFHVICTYSTTLNVENIVGSSNKKTFHAILKGYDMSKQMFTHKDRLKQIGQYKGPWYFPEYISFMTEVLSILLEK